MRQRGNGGCGAPVEADGASAFPEPGPGARGNYAKRTINKRNSNRKLPKAGRPCVKVLIRGSIKSFQSDFCRKTGISTSALSNVLKRGSGVSTSNLEQIAAAYPTLNLRWLVAGEDPMWINGAAPAPPYEAPELTYEQLATLLHHRVRELERELKDCDPERARRLGIK